MQSDVEFLRSVLQVSGDCIVGLDWQGHTLFVSPGAITSMEISDVPGIIGLPWARVWKDADHEAALAAIAQARQGGTGRFQGFCPTHRGTPKWWDVVISPMPGRGDGPARLVVIARDITDLKRAEQRLAKSEERLNLALGASDLVGIWDWDLTQDIVHADANFARLTSVDPALAATGAPLSLFMRNLHPQDLGLFQAELDRVKAGAARFSCEYRIRQPDGRDCWVHASGRVLQDDAGTPVRFAGTSIDITARRQSDLRRLARLELGDRLRVCDDLAEMTSIAAEVLGRTLAAARAGYGEVDAARALVDVPHDWTLPGVATIAGVHQFADFGSYLGDLLRGETVIIDDVAQDPRTAEAAEAWRAIMVRAIVNIPVFESGVLVAVLFLHAATAHRWRPEELEFARHVADRTRAGMARLRAEMRLRELASSLERQVAERTADRNRLWALSRDIMLVADASGAIASVNPAWQAVLGWADAEVTGRHLPDFVHPEERERIQATLEFLSSGSVPATFTSRLRHRDGGFRWIAWDGVPDGGLIHAVGRDFTAEHDKASALEQAEEKLRQSQKMEAVGQLTGGLAHDFNNLLAGISGSLQLMRKRIEQGHGAEISRYLDAAQDSARRAAALTHRLLAFARRQPLAPDVVDINRLVGAMEDLIRRTMGPQIEIAVILGPDLWPTLVDPNQLENALLNLCINARDAMPEGGRLSIETANHDRQEADLPEGRHVMLSVSDTGVGMSAETLRRAFEPFFTTKPSGEGTGLGLSMIYGFVQQSGGVVRMSSTLGAGTTIRLLLPRHDGTDSAREP